MANRRAPSLPELGPLNTPGEVAGSTKFNQVFTNNEGASILGASGLAHQAGAPGSVSRTMGECGSATSTAILTFALWRERDISDVSEEQRAPNR
jgi:hypothetical protein